MAAWLKREERERGKKYNGISSENENEKSELHTTLQEMETGGIFTGCWFSKPLFKFPREEKEDEKRTTKINNNNNKKKKSEKRDGVIYSTVKLLIQLSFYAYK